MKRLRGALQDRFAVAVVASALAGAACAAAAIVLAARGATMWQGRLPLGLLLAFASTLLLALAVLLWREREVRRARAAFVAAVSHELRTSLAQIRMFTETLQEDRARSQGDRERSAAIIGQEARRLAHLVETVRRYDALARHGVALHRREVRLAEVVERVVETFGPLAAGRRILLETELAPSVEVHADAEALQQILASLLDNAVKYGTTGGTIRIGAGPTGSGGAGARATRIWVEDRGPGVPAEERESVWEPFRRLQRDPEAVTGGGGLGLAVVRSLVHLHGGRCWVEDPPEGGARFVVELPGVPA